MRKNKNALKTVAAVINTFFNSEMLLHSKLGHLNDSISSQQSQIQQVCCLKNTQKVRKK